MPPRSKLCPTCRKRKGGAGFGVNRARPDGLQSQCKECKRASQRSWYERNKSRHVANVARTRRAAEVRLIGKLVTYLRDHPCVDCGEADPVLLEFDHVRGIKLNSVCNLVSRGFSWEKLLVKFRSVKFAVARCHRLKTAEQFGYRKRLFSPSA